MSVALLSAAPVICTVSSAGDAAAAAACLGLFPTAACPTIPDTTATPAGDAGLLTHGGGRGSEGGAGPPLYVNLGAVVDKDDPVPKTRFFSALGPVGSVLITAMALGWAAGCIFGAGVLDRRTFSSRFTVGGSGASGSTGMGKDLTSVLTFRGADRERCDLPRGSG